jgi:hypothetical protein
MDHHRRRLLTAAALAAALPRARAQEAGAPQLEVWKDPACG